MGSAADAGGTGGSNTGGAGGGDGAGLVFLAGGDLSSSFGEQEATSKLLRDLMKSKPIGALLTLGDHAYEDVSASDLEQWYTPHFGTPEILAITHPAPGNHEYQTQDAKDYFDYFNGSGNATGKAGDRDKGYYSFDLGGWHFIALNTNDDCSQVACDEGSPQLTWLRSDLAANKARCTVAYMHHPRWNQGNVHGNSTVLAGVWDALYDAGADIVIAAHEHSYQQFAPMDKAGKVDKTKGIRLFIAGSAGSDIFTEGFNKSLGAASEYNDNKPTHFGFLEVTTAKDSYEWRFVTVGGSAVVSGKDVCH
jgi:hypothetical protein